VTVSWGMHNHSYSGVLVPDRDSLIHYFCRFPTYTNHHFPEIPIHIFSYSSICLTILPLLCSRQRHLCTPRCALAHPLTPPFPIRASQHIVAYVCVVSFVHASPATHTRLLYTCLAARLITLLASSHSYRHRRLLYER
jgi:hypothetical protein